MSNVPYRSKFNWSVVEGEIPRQVSYNIHQANETTDLIPQEKLLDPDACLVLEPDESQEFCEQSISVNPMYQVLKLALLVECSRIESYLGRTQEYHQTYHGELVFDEDTTKLYRFDVTFEVCGTCEFKLRYISSRDERLCLYGMHLVLEKNSNPLGMFSGGGTLDRAMIECRLDDNKLSEKAARCKEFMLGSMGKYQMFQNLFNNNSNNGNLNSTMTPSSSGGLSDDLSAVTSSSGVALRPEALPAAEGPPQHPAPPTGTGSFNELLAMRYIDSKFVELQNMLDAKLQVMQAQQNQKLDQILSLLNSLNSK